MTKLKNFITELHQSTKRDFLSRMNDNKIECMKVAKKFEDEYWDGDRRFGYGGYKLLPGRWKPLAEKLINQYNLTNKSKLLDIGCGKGFLLHEIKNILPEISITGVDISKHAIKEVPDNIKKSVKVFDARNKFPFKDNEFDLLISINTLHNFKIHDLKLSLQECERVAKDKYLVVEGYRNEEELFNLQCWALTCESFFTDKEWIWIFKEFGYTGDYEFIYF